MIAYRLGRKKYIRDLSGEGARLYGGRWNRKGTPMLYASEHCSLALLEHLVHASKHLLPKDVYLLKFFIPDEIEISSIERNSLPKNWKQYPAPETLAYLGTKWCKNEETAGLKVPSVIVPDERNILLNPLHSQFRECKIEAVSAFN